MTIPNPSWKVWCDNRDPLFEGGENEAKEYLKTQCTERDDVYLEDPDGREFMPSESGNIEWVPAT